MKDLETKNLKIRKFQIGDTKDVYNNLATEEELADYLEYNIHRNLEETKAMVTSYIKEYEMNELFWAIEEKTTNTVIGFINALEESRTHKCCKIKFGIGLKWVNTGYMEEALDKILEYLFYEEDFNLVISNFYDGNKKFTQIKENMLQNVGMIKEACLRNRKINDKNGRAENRIVYSIIKEEFDIKNKVNNFSKAI